MDRKIIYLINPISGTRGKSSLQELISRKTGAQHISFQILPTNAEGDYRYLFPLIESEKITDIVICGGDGTVSAVAAALSGSQARIGIIPMGSGNGLAFAAGIPRDPGKALDIILAGKASYIDGFTINGRFSCMLCGIGFDAHVAHEFAVQPSRGLKTYIRVTYRNFFSMRAHRFRIRLDTPEKTSFGVEAFFIDIANGNQFGNNFTIAPKARLDDGLLDIVVARKSGKLRLLYSVIRQVFGGYGIRQAGNEPESGRILYFRASSLTIENIEEAPLHIDGDPAATAREFAIKVIPKAIRLIQP